MENSESRSKEQIADVSLKAREVPGHGILFEFTAPSESVSKIYNRVIEQVLSTVGSPTPHGPVAEGKGCKTGYQNWQIETIDIKQAQELIPTIHTLAKKLFEEAGS